MIFYTVRNKRRIISQVLGPLISDRLGIGSYKQSTKKTKKKICM